MGRGVGREGKGGEGGSHVISAKFVTKYRELKQFDGCLIMKITQYRFLVEYNLKLDSIRMEKVFLKNVIKAFFGLYVR